MKLVLTDVCKEIRKKTILSHISLELTSGNVYAFVGENGSGKTMLFRAISGLMDLTSGTVTLDGKELHKDFEVLPDLGLTIENAGLYPELTGMENLRLLAKLNKKIGDEEIREAIERVGLDPKDRRSFRKYSLGMKQRIVVAQAIMEKPDILLLDEPTNALDEDGVDLVRKIILEEKERGALVLIADHNPEDVRLLADKVYRISRGVVTEGKERGEKDGL
ncbi:MAG: ATP-binding cassette domain-containing protein [Lachnospiraceae bacterium]|nr:ATP-binding cassette domain-containing protein [Lachnospiraceae bacterium]